MDSEVEDDLVAVGLDVVVVEGLVEIPQIMETRTTTVGFLRGTDYLNKVI